MSKNKSVQNSEFITSSILNNLTYRDYMYRFKKIATSIFEWKNLPESCDARFLEECLYYNGKASFLNTEDLGFINLQATPSAELNIYGLPVKINCWSFNKNIERELYTGLPNNEEDNECILIMNNSDMIPTFQTMRLFSYRLYQAQRTIDTNIELQKFPLVFQCNDKQRLTLMNLFKNFVGNIPIIFADKKLFQDNIKIEALKTEVPFIADKIEEYKLQLWNEALTFLGITNINEKKERLTENESNVNNEIVNANLQSFLKYRKLACEQINKKYSLNVDVEVTSDLENIIKKYSSTNTLLNPEISEGVEVNE